MELKPGPEFNFKELATQGGGRFGFRSGCFGAKRFASDVGVQGVSLHRRNGRHKGSFLILT